MIAISPQPTQYRAVIRFSVFDPASNAWRASRDAFSSPQEYRDWLWSEDRLTDRFELFTHYAAPQYQRIAGRHDFRVLLQHSRSMPDPWLERLHQLAADYPALRLTPVDRSVSSAQTVHEDLQHDGRTGTVVMLRVDDDDLLSTDFLDLMAPYVLPEHHRYVISLSQGLAIRYVDGVFNKLRLLHFPFGSIGQAVIGRFRAETGTIDLPNLGSHREVSRHRPSIVDAREVSWLQVRHLSQDTRLGNDMSRARKHISTILDRLERPGDIPELRRKFPVFTDVFDRLERAEANA